MLERVKRPDGTEISFEYDALGRRTAKINEATKEITRFVWDGNVPLHEWKYALENRPQIVANELGELSLDKKEPTENLITWIFDEGSFVPSAKITKEDTFSIVSDYLGTPCLMYNSVGNLVWQADLDIYGKVRTLSKGNINDCPFRYQGQYHDAEVDLYYNRFRYYSPESGTYISQDPIRLFGSSELYKYTDDTNKSIDPFGLSDCPFDDLKKLRDDLGLEGGALTRLDIGKSKFYGINSWKQRLSKSGKKIVADDAGARKAFADAGLVNPKTGKTPISTFTNHAEGDSFLQAFKKGGFEGETGRLYVDRDVCGWCKSNLASMKDALGLDKLEVFENIDGNIISTIY